MSINNITEKTCLSLYTDSLYLYLDISLSISLCWNPHPTHWGLLWLHPPCLLKQQQRQQEEKQCINSLKNNLNNKNRNKNKVVATFSYFEHFPPRKIGKRWNPFWRAHIFKKMAWFNTTTLEKTTIKPTTMATLSTNQPTLQATGWPYTKWWLRWHETA